MNSRNAVIEVFWVPGCSSCLRCKEFLESTGLPYENVNLSIHPERGEDIKRLGLNVPAVVVGDRGEPGLDLVAIARLIGYEYDPPEMLSPAALKEKYDLTMRKALSLFAQIPPEGLEYKSPDRDRNLRSLCGHLASIVRVFLRAYEEDIYPGGQEVSPPEVRTTDELIAYARDSLALFDGWWDKMGYDDPYDRVIDTYWGHRTLHEVFERVVWHTAQHTRQVALFLERMDITPEQPLTAEDIAGLPMPERVQA